ncbi:hypothetical protein GIB67_010463 [Kingdonia uniflora]|uniref:Uncharacterized protein n=1 Tax=Kingdonia uniflora TaxID=39325 RepID=A0A7J7MAI8_9MAGN|nr:hypothetical protein GIB67_010463 [Kingdonia uniflora]
MVSNPSTTVILKPLSLSNLISLSSKSKIPFCNPQVRRVSTISPICRSSSSSNSHIPTFIFGSKLSFKDLGRREIGFKQMGFDWFRVSAVSDGGVGGNGGGFGGNGGGNSGGGSGDGDEKRWPLLSWYLAALEKYPVLTKALTTALLNCIGDLICQLLIDKVSTVDLKRTLLFTFLGFVLVGPTLHFWYLNLSKMVTIPGATGVVLRLLLDQFLFSPIFIGVFLSSLVTLEGRPSQVVPKLQQARVVFCRSCQLATLDTISVSQLPICTTAIPGSCCKCCRSRMECDSLIQSSQRGCRQIAGCEGYDANYVDEAEATAAAQSLKDAKKLGLS